MYLHEYQGKALFREYGLPVSTGIACDTAEEAVAAAKQIGGDMWVVKAQVHAGGRGKAGGVKLVKNFPNFIFGPMCYEKGPIDKDLRPPMDLWFPIKTKLIRD